VSTESMDYIIAAAITAPEWQPRHSYKVEDYVKHRGSHYRAYRDHDSGDSFANDLAAMKWELVAWASQGPATARDARIEASDLSSGFWIARTRGIYTVVELDFGRGEVMEAGDEIPGNPDKYELIRRIDLPDEVTE
jgi:hypothetical protein